MIPAQELLQEEMQESTYLQVEEESSRTYYIQQEKKRTVGQCDNLEAIKQAVWKIIHTERYESLIYSNDYGIELRDLIGEDITFVMSEIKDRISEALLQDSRMKEINQFEITRKKDTLYVTFQVITELGDFTQGMEVSI